MSYAEVIVTHETLVRSVTISVDRYLLARARTQPRAQSAFVCLFKEAYEKEVGDEVPFFIKFEDLTLEETPESQPYSCNCNCPGCDQGYHCHKTDKDCYV